MRSSGFTLASLLPLSLTAAASFTCKNFTVPVDITARSYEVSFPPFDTELESVAFLLKLTSTSSSSSSSGSSIFKGNSSVTATYNISAAYCAPSTLSGSNAHTVQVLTHGLGFDKSYWAFGGDTSDYNYIAHATGAGYSTLSYDRLGTGASSYPNPYNIVQAPTELEILIALTQKLRNGTLCPSENLPKPAKVLHVGHSFGSFLTNTLVAAAPTLSDGIVLTGYSTQSAGQTEWLVSTMFHQARFNSERFAALSSGYLTWGAALANQYGFFYYPNYNASVLNEAEATKYPFTIGEMLTGALLNSTATAYTGPVLVSVTRSFPC